MAHWADNSVVQETAGVTDSAGARSGEDSLIQRPSPRSGGGQWFADELQKITNLIDGMQKYFYGSYQTYKRTQATKGLKKALEHIQGLAAGIERLSFKVTSEVTTFSLFYNFLNFFSFRYT